MLCRGQHRLEIIPGQAETYVVVVGDHSCSLSVDLTSSVPCRAEFGPVLDIDELADFLRVSKSTLREAGLSKVKEGITTLENVLMFGLP